MGVLTDLIIASSDEADEVAHAHAHAERWPTLDMKGFSSICFSMIFAILRNEEVDTFNNELLAAGDMEEGPWVTRVPNGFVEEVATMQDQQLLVASRKLADSEELSGWSASDVEARLRELRSFCTQARDTGIAVLMWASL